MAAKKGIRKKVAHKRTVTIKRQVTSYTYYHTCDWCGESFQSTRSNARFCSSLCRVRAHRAKE